MSIFVTCKNIENHIMTIDIQELDGKIITTLSGELDTNEAEEVETALRPLLEREGMEIIIDCTHLEYIASSGLRILLSILKKARNSGSRVVLKNVNDVVHDVLDMTGLVNIFELEQDN